MKRHIKILLFVALAGIASGCVTHREVIQERTAQKKGISSGARIWILFVPINIGEKNAWAKSEKRFYKKGGKEISEKVSRKVVIPLIVVTIVPKWYVTK